MIIVDTALRQRAAAGKPVTVGLIGAGYMGRAIAAQIITATPGMRLVAVCSRSPGSAERVYRESGVAYVSCGSSAREIEQCVASGGYAVTDDPDAICAAAGIDAVVEATGDVEHGANVAYEAIRNGKHVVLMNAEVDSAIGPILKVHADRNGVVYTYSDGDEPGVAMNLCRFVDGIGYRPVLTGQIKGFLDHYRNPETQRAFAEKHGQKAEMVASFADGSKLAIESAILGNATGFTPAVRGMHGHHCEHVKDIITHFSPADFRDGGHVDFVLGAAPHSGAFVVGFNDEPVKRQYMSYFKMGDGPLYVFYIPFHLPHLQLPSSVARAVLFHDATLAPRGAPVCDTISVAKRALKAGETLDGMGGFCCYGVVEKYDICAAMKALPIPLSIGCRLRRDIAKDEPLSYDDVVLPEGRIADRLRAEQTAYFAKQTTS